MEAESRRTKYSFNYARKTLLSAITIYGILNRVRGVRLWCCGLVAEWKAISACTSRDTFLFPGPRNRAFPDLPSDRNGRLVAIYLRNHSPRSFYLRGPRCIPSRFTSPFDLPLCGSGVFVAVLKISRCIDSDVHGDSELIRSLKSVSISNETSRGGEEVKEHRGRSFRNTNTKKVEKNFSVGERLDGQRDKKFHLPPYLEEPRRTTHGYAILFSRLMNFYIFV